VVNGLRKGCYSLGSIVACFIPVLEGVTELTENDVLSGANDEITAIREICSLYEKGMKCLKEKQNTCEPPTKHENEQLNIFLEQVVRQGVIKFCGEERVMNAYIVNAKCLFDNQNYTQNCLVRTQKAFKHVKIQSEFSTSNDGSMEKLCRIITKMFKCGSEALENRCGKQAGQLFVRIASDFLPQEITNKCIKGGYIPASVLTGQHRIATTMFMTSSSVASSTSGCSNLKTLTKWQSWTLFYSAFLCISIGICNLYVAFMYDY
ncbi:unnamed protein product, partial [Owenia fusiformis]